MVTKSRQKTSNSPLEPGMPNPVEAAFGEVYCSRSSLGDPPGAHRLHSGALRLIDFSGIRPKASCVWDCRSILRSSPLQALHSSTGLLPALPPRSQRMVLGGLAWAAGPRRLRQDAPCRVSRVRAQFGGSLCH